MGDEPDLGEQGGADSQRESALLFPASQVFQENERDDRRIRTRILTRVVFGRRLRSLSFRRLPFSRLRPVDAP